MQLLVLLQRPAWAHLAPPAHIAGGVYELPPAAALLLRQGGELLSLSVAARRGAKVGVREPGCDVDASIANPPH